MQAGHVKRRFVLLLPLAFAACAGDEDQVFEPLRYNYLPPIQLNVASIGVEQRFVPSGVAPDVSNQDPVPPVEALKAMANDRLQAFGTANKAVFAIQDAALTQQGDVTIGSMTVSLTILDDSGAQQGFAEARVQSRHAGQSGSERAMLYDLTKSMMRDMNIEFEYQIRHNLKPWLTTGAAPDTPVQQAPLDQSGGHGQGDTPTQPTTPGQQTPQSGSPGQPTLADPPTATYQPSVPPSDYQSPSYQQVPSSQPTPLYQQTPATQPYQQAPSDPSTPR